MIQEKSRNMRREPYRRMAYRKETGELIMEDEIIKDSERSEEYDKILAMELIRGLEAMEKFLK